MIFGLLAASMTTLAFLPQVLKVWKDRQTKNISLGMYVIFVLGIIFWLIYGLMINDLPIILANIVSLLLSSTVLFFKLKYK